MASPTPMAALLIAGLIPATVAAVQPYDPGVPSPAQAHIPSSAPTSPPTRMGELDWRAANDTVGALTRGHIDILRWESENPSPSAASAPPDGPRLSPAEAVRIALANRPEMFATTDMSAQERARADIAAVALARDVHRAWISAVVAEQSLRHARDVLEATEAGTELAVRMTRGGNWGEDRLMREQLTLSDAGIRSAQAQQAAVGAREALIRLLGVWGDATRFSLPEGLPALPETPMSDLGLEATALRNHPQLSLSAIEADRERRAVAPRMLESWPDIIAAALSRMDNPAATSENPLEGLISSAPLLDLRRTPGEHGLLRAASAQAHAAKLAVKIRSQVREAFHQYRIAYDIARTTRDDVVRLRAALYEDTVLRYNGMLKSTWDLLASARDQVASADAALAAQRDFWLAHTNLQAVLAGADYAGPDAISTGNARTDRAGGH